MNPDLSTLEARRAHALLALDAGRPADADALLEVLGSIYERHGHRAGLLALQYNRLLAAVMGGDRRSVPLRLREVIDSMRAADERDETVMQVAAGLSRLFAQPVVGIEPEQSATLAALVAQWSPSVERAQVVWPGDPPSAERLSGLSAADAAAEALAWAAAAWGQPDVPDWIAALRAHFGPPAALSESARSYLTEAAEQMAEPDVLRAYGLVVDAIEQALDSAPHLVAAWAQVLDALEAEGVPERIDFLPQLPRDRGHALRAELHRRIAQALEGVAGAEALALAQWRAVETHAGGWQQRVEARRARGTARAAEYSVEATLCVWRAEAARAEGDLAAARIVLRPTAERARRRALDNATAAAHVLLALAEVEERAGALPAAANAYADAFGRALPAGELSDDAASLIDAIDRVVGEDRDGRQVALGLLAYLGHARTTQDLTPARVEAARDALAVARPVLSGDDVQQLRLVIEASAAAVGIEGAALQAAEAAVAMRAPAVEALALAWAARARAGETPEEAADLRDRAAHAARRAAAGPLRHAAELLLAEFARAEGDEDRVAVALRRAAEVYEGPHLGPGADAWSHLVQAGLGDAGALLARLVESQRHTPLVRRLGAAIRRAGLVVAPPAVPEVVGVASPQAIRARARWLVGAPPLQPDAPSLTVGGEGGNPDETRAHRRLEARWPALVPGPDDVQLEFTVFDDWTLACCADEDGVTLRRLAVGRAALADGVRRFGGLLIDAEPDDFEALFEASRRLSDTLFEPFAQRLAMRRRLWIAPDGPLVALSFAPLLFRGAFLGERFELVELRPALAPLFDPDGPAAPPHARLLGDAITADDLRLTMLVDGGAVEVFDARHGADLDEAGLHDACADVRLLHVAGEVDPSGAVALHEEAPPTAAAALADALAQGGVVAAVLVGPVEGQAGRRLVRALLPAVRGGLLVRGWDAPDDQTFLWTFYHHAAGATDAEGLAMAVCAARRATVRVGRDPRGWAAFSLVVGC